MNPRPHSSLALVVVVSALSSLITPPIAFAAPPAPYGVLVMAHGGGPIWNQNVLDAVKPLAERHPVEVAFGMADACSMREGVVKLESRGVRRIGVVRLFVSGESWYERTEEILGLREGAPAATVATDGAIAECAPVAPAAHAGHVPHPAPAGGHSMALFRIDSKASFSLSREGLMEGAEMGGILLARASALSLSPATEDVLILAHGPEDDAENERWLAHLKARADSLRPMAFHSVSVETLREDWPEKRREAEARIRALVERAATEGRRVLVLPFRLSGFGPYAQIFEGQTYVADQLGLLPHPAVGAWIARQAEALEGTQVAP